MGINSIRLQSLSSHLSSGPAILRFPLIWRQWSVGNDVLTNVAIVVVHSVGLAPSLGLVEIFRLVGIVRQRRDSS